MLKTTPLLLRLILFPARPTPLVLTATNNLATHLCNRVRDTNFAIIIWIIHVSLLEFIEHFGRRPGYEVHTIFKHFVKKCNNRQYQVYSHQ